MARKPLKGSSGSRSVVRLHEQNSTLYLMTDHLHVPMLQTWAVLLSMKMSEGYGKHGSNLDQRYALASGTSPNA